MEESRKLPFLQPAELNDAKVASLTSLANAKLIEILIQFLQSDNLDKRLLSENTRSQVKQLPILPFLQLKKEKLEKLQEISKTLTTVHEEMETANKSNLEAYAPIITNDVKLQNVKMLDDLFETNLDAVSYSIESKTHQLANLKKCLTYEETKHRLSSPSVPKGEKETDVNNAAAPLTEAFVTEALQNWRQNRLGEFSFPDQSHFLLDISKSELWSGPRSLDSSRCSTRIRARLQDPKHDKAFSLDEVHPYNSDFETMDLANQASCSGVLSLVLDHLHWQTADRT